MILSRLRWLILLGALVCLPTAQAAACLCGYERPERYIASSDAIFFASVRDVFGGAVILDVHFVWKGRVGATVLMTQETHSCARSFYRREAAMVFAYREGASLIASYCAALAYEDRPTLFEAYLSRMKRYAPEPDSSATTVLR